MAAAEKSYYVTGTIMKDGEMYHPGDKIELTADEAKDLATEISTTKPGAKAKDETKEDETNTPPQTPPAGDVYDVTKAANKWEIIEKLKELGVDATDELSRADLEALYTTTVAANAQ